MKIYIYIYVAQGKQFLWHWLPKGFSQGVGCGKLRGVNSSHQFFFGISTLDLWPLKPPPKNLLHEKNPGWFGCIGGLYYPLLLGFVISHYKNPFEPTSIMESHMFFFVAWRNLPCEHIFCAQKSVHLSEKTPCANRIEHKVLWKPWPSLPVWLDRWATKAAFVIFWLEEIKESERHYW